MSMNLSPVGLGTAQLGNLYRSTTDEEARATVDAAWDSGVRYFDTAPHYGLGLAERRLGEALSGRPRDEYVLSSKVGRLLVPAPELEGQEDEDFVVPADLRREWDFSRDGVLRSIEASLDRLGLDRLDIVYVHDPDDHWDQASREAVPTLVELRDQGVVRAVGVGMKQSDMLARFVRETDVDLAMCTGRYTLLEQGALADLLPAVLERDVGVVVAGVFRSGLLANPRPGADASYNDAPAPPEVLDKATRIADVCERYGVDLPTVALSFVRAHPAVVSTVVGMCGADQVVATMERSHAPVPVELWEDLRAEWLIDPMALVPRTTFPEITL